MSWSFRNDRSQGCGGSGMGAGRPRQVRLSHQAPGGGPAELEGLPGRRGDSGYGIAHGVHGALFGEVPDCAGADGRVGGRGARGGGVKRRRAWAFGRRERGPGLAGPRAADRGGGHRQAVGIGFQSWTVDADTVERARRHRPAAVMLSFGDPRPRRPVRRPGMALIVQGHRPGGGAPGSGSRRGRDRGAGHRGRRAQWPGMVHPAVRARRGGSGRTGAGAGSQRDCRRARPDRGPGAGRGRYADQHPVPGYGRGPGRSGGQEGDHRGQRGGDRAKPRPGHRPRCPLAGQVPGPRPGPLIPQPVEGREAELAADPQARQAYQDGIAQGGLPPQPIWASQAIDLIRDLPPAADLVGALAAQAENALARAGTL